MGKQWSLLPVMVLRQAGFPFDMLAPFAVPQTATEAERITELQDRVAQLVPGLKSALREAGVADGGAASSRMASLRPFPEAGLRSLAAHLPAEAAAELKLYQDAAGDLAVAWHRWEEEHRARMRASADRLREEFRGNPLLRDALLLSNEATFPLFAEWLDAPGPVAGPRGRKMTDVLSLYLQRFASKNETHSHFGPLNVARVDQGMRGVMWREESLRRRVFLSHWAAEKIAGTLGSDPGLADRVRPRRRPWAFERDGLVTRYAFTTENGYSADWEFTGERPVTLTPGQASLLRRCDGTATRAELREELGPGTDADLAALVELDLVVARFEVPVGVTDPLPVLREQAGDVASLREMERLLRSVPNAVPGERQSAINALREGFTALTGAEGNRGSGRHYADRSVFYEECHGPVGDLRLGGDLATLIDTELAPVYALALAVPRLRIAREGAMLARWAAGRFGSEAEVPLDRFYSAYFADRAALTAECDRIDGEVDALDQRLSDVLLGDADRRAAEVEVSRERLDEFLRSCPGDSPALLNPDVMLAAADAAALARGEFLAVVGDCHGTRELLSHSSFAPLVAEECPGFAAEVTAAYRHLAEPDEVLCDLARSHPDKTSARITLGLPDVEIYGRSGLPRERVIQPSRMYLAVSGGRLALRARGIGERLRLLAPPSGGPSVTLDPLAPFAFPRRLGGLLLRADRYAHVPRIRSGRVVLQRELWRLPVEEFSGSAPPGMRRTGNAAEFYAAHLLRRRYGLPQHVFAKTEGEPKPLYVDFTSPLLVRQLFRMARGASGHVMFSEMLPGPDHMWLSHEGRRFTTEIRCAVFSRRPELSRESK